jgi:hypothetical protein
MVGALEINRARGDDEGREGPSFNFWEVKKASLMR